MSKTYAGARLRRLREERRMSQAELARVLGISPSYLNQMEHDSRPLTVPVLLRLTEAFGVDPGFFSERDTSRLVADLREALAGEVAEARVSPTDLAELASRMPAVAKVLLDLSRRGQVLAERIAGETDNRDGRLPAPRSPHEEIREFFYRRQNYLHDTDLAAEELAHSIGIHPGDVVRVLAHRLTEKHGVRPTTRAAERLHHYDSASRTLHLSSRLRPGQRAFRMATQLALLEYGNDIDRLAAEDFPPGSPTHALARIGVANYFAAALILPYGAFHAAAEEARYDIERLTDRFGLGYETVCHRLSTLQRPRLRGVPFSFVRVDRAGNMSKRQSATGFHFSRAGGTCPLWNVYEAFAAPGRIHVQIAAMPDGQRYLWTARAITRHRGGWGEPGKTFAIGLGCEIRHASRLVYSDGLDLDNASAATPIGMGCRICERLDCPQRAVPPLGRPLTIDENSSTFVPYPVADSTG
ncbi:MULTISPECIES: short-chain fatty acyl-CoA regulator family protein [unclassified Streptomyces]|uniref:short-chain fatty acyl-CoA regulator family protein n=1 Tax=unclassified Streptomyces TaxID=2593676 RepID=UPI002DDC8F20|nr:MULTISPECIES: short-chain fatty acyl-CoA regulator family protein [unclassified Streptomyces]WSF83912.1 short-chain fatty acyl-CoA regulator family protein [Streptomyces sp. NBC_01744]WSC39803.1 short-chain fatty acyl-CoA regulator family protein [Streptomyces sp. NBC_01763]WSC47971.1 short-chain fatty acyl-CoA regulator family protein [Streptomyces sp. NBC_01762]WSC53068.1 short-chain fatty acyl-CoA regulator family protein [Streptomyces sp. NBC_01761]WSD27621.1 short-chain fatty acyl-CoA 